MSFQDFGLSPELLRALNELGHYTPTPVQQQAIPVVLRGTDTMALAQTGTGKTAAFTLPLLHLLHTSHDATKAIRQVRALILTPTRELAAQVGESVRNYGSHLNLRSEIIFGGVNITPQINKLKRGTDIVVATPGRLLDLIEQRAVSLSKVEIFVLDEADRMLDMGFIKDVKKVLALLPKQRQNLLFSATLSTEIQGLADSILRNSKLIEVASRNVTTELVTQVVYPVDQKRKRELLSYLIGFNNWLQVLIFTRTKHGANKLCEQLIEDGLTAAAIHGNKSQGARTRALDEFKNGKIRVLVATDIAARGIDIEHLPYVVNFELPNVAEDYVHRIGRTGRAGKSGNAISLVCISEEPLLRDIEKLTKKTIARKVIPGYEPDQSIKAEPINNRSRNPRGAQAPSSRSGDFADRRSRPSGDRRNSYSTDRSDSQPRFSDRRGNSFTQGSGSQRPTGERRSFSDRSDSQPRFSDRRGNSFAPRTDSRGAAGERRSFSDRSDSQSRFSDRRGNSFAQRSDSQRPTGERRSFSDRSDSQPRFSDRRGNSFAQRSDSRGAAGERRSFSDRSDSQPRFSDRRGNSFAQRSDSRGAAGERRGSFAPRTDSRGIASERRGNFAPRTDSRGAAGERRGSFAPRTDSRGAAGERRGGFSAVRSFGDRRDNSQRPTRVRRNDTDKPERDNSW